MELHSHKRSREISSSICKASICFLIYLDGRNPNLVDVTAIQETVYFPETTFNL